MSPLDFFYQNFISRITDSLKIEISVEDCMSLQMPCSTVEKVKADGTIKKAAVSNLRMGAKDVFFLCTAERAVIISPYQVTDSPFLEVRTTAKAGPKKQIAQLLLELPEQPFMAGVISKANAEKALRVSPHTRLGYFCEMGAGFAFDLGKVKDARESMGDLNWKVVQQALYRLQDARFEPSKQEAAHKELVKACRAHPDLEGFLEGTDIIPGSGEFELLSWLNFDDKA